MSRNKACCGRRKTIAHHYVETLSASLLIMLILSVMLISKDRVSYKTDLITAESIGIANSTTAYYSYLISVVLRSDAMALQKHLTQIEIEEVLESAVFLRPGQETEALLKKCHDDPMIRKVSGYIPSCYFLENDRLQVIQEFTSGSRTIGYLFKSRKLLAVPILSYILQRPLLLSWLLFMVIFGAYYMRQLHLHLVRPLAFLSRKAQELKLDDVEDYKLHEVHFLACALASAHDELVEKSKLAAIGEIASQVAHDIRSPLTALKVVSGHVAELPEEKRVMIRNAVQRIEDIANDLAERKQPNTQKEGNFDKRELVSVQLLSSLIEPLISEKRIQYRSKLGIHIQSTLDAGSYGIFSSVQPIELKRVLSNLINNAVEALGNEGMVTVDLQTADNTVRIAVRDNGPGIPEELLPQLMQRGATRGKAGGSGLGLFHARTAVESWGGTIFLESKKGHGTLVTLTVPQAEAPSWFVPELRIAPGSMVVIIDDDSSIHQVWEERFDAFMTSEQHITLRHFSSGEAVQAWRDIPQKTLFLCDYELLGEPNNGLDLIERLNVQDRAILVTSRYEEDDVRQRCANMEIQIIPKGLAGFVPIVAEEKTTERECGNGSGYRVLVIDDDEGIQLCWKLEKERLGVGELLAYNSIEACETAAVDYAAIDMAFIDKHIEGSAWNLTKMISYLKKRGVKKVIVASGDAAHVLAKDEGCALADGVAKEKIPETLADFG